MDNLWVIAQIDSNAAPSRIGSEAVSTKDQTTATVAEPNAPPTEQKPSGLQWPLLLMWGLLFVVMYMFLFRGPRKRQQQEQQKLVQSLQKNDRVRTIGGILGTVVDVRGDEVVLKVDEANNTKIRVMTSAIGVKLSNDEKK